MIKANALSLLTCVATCDCLHLVAVANLKRTSKTDFFIYQNFYIIILHIPISICNDLYTKREALIFHAKLTVTFPNVDIVIQVHTVTV